MDENGTVGNGVLSNKEAYAALLKGCELGSYDACDASTAVAFVAVCRTDMVTGERKCPQSVPTNSINYSVYDKGGVYKNMGSEPLLRGYTEDIIYENASKNKNKLCNWPYPNLAFSEDFLFDEYFDISGGASVNLSRETCHQLSTRPRGTNSARKKSQMVKSFIARAKSCYWAKFQEKSWDFYDSHSNHTVEYIKEEYSYRHACNYSSINDYYISNVTKICDKKKSKGCTEAKGHILKLAQMQKDEL